MWINILSLKEQCQKLINRFPELKINKVVEKNGDFIFYRIYQNINKMEYETTDFRKILVKKKIKKKAGVLII